MSRDEAYYPEPDEFRPERHLGATSPGSEKEARAGGEAPYELPSNFVFGFGRRFVQELELVCSVVLVLISDCGIQKLSRTSIRGSRNLACGSAHHRDVRHQKGC